MQHCPNCFSALRTVRQRDGIFFQCDPCGGRAVTLPQIRRVAGDRFATNLLVQINRNPNLGDRDCPFCTQKMQRFNCPEPHLELDACKRCALVWFDPHEFETIPDGAPESAHELHLRAAEALGRHRLEQLKERDALPGGGPDEEWKMVPALFGFPVECHTDPLSCRPWITWALALTVAVVSVAAFFELERIIAAYGFIPSEATRYGGLTLLTAFFLHAGIVHLVGNLYFLLIFGDNVEDYLGRWRYAWLILAATVAGGVVHWLAQPGSARPCVGASGGISGVIVFYALQFPRARLGFLFRYFMYFRWIQIPAWGALCLWVLLQTFGMYSELSGAGNVAATAHLGGAAAGFCFWLWQRMSVRESFSG